MFTLLFLCFSILKYSVFGSILTFGGMVGALVSGRVADIVGRRIVSFFSRFSCYNYSFSLHKSIWSLLICFIYNVDYVDSGNILHHRMDFNTFWKGTPVFIHLTVISVWFSISSNSFYWSMLLFFCGVKL